MTEQTMTTGEKIGKVVQELSIEEIIFQLENRVGEENLNWMAKKSENYIHLFPKDRDIMEKAVKLLNDLKVNKLVSFEIIENVTQILVSPDIKKYL